MYPSKAACEKCVVFRTKCCFWAKKPFFLVKKSFSRR